MLSGSFFSVLPEAATGLDVPEWHIGNIYELGRSTPNAIELPVAPSWDSPTTYQLVVSGDYEVGNMSFSRDTSF